MRNLSIFLCILISNVLVAGFMLIPRRTTGWQGRNIQNRRLQHIGTDSGDVQVCQQVITSQPAVLVHSKKDCRPFYNWQGIKFKLDVDVSLHQPGLLPYVGRLETVTSTTLAIMSNLDQAKYVQEGFYAEKKMLRLVGSGALPGAGKTTVGPLVHQCLQRMLGEDKRVISVVSKVKAHRSMYCMWIEDVCATPGMEELQVMIKEEMSFIEVIKATECYLTERKMVMFLHLDDFTPFHKAGCTANTPQDFSTCWHRMLMPILCSPSIGLYISGHMPYFDSACYASGQPPCNALSVQFDLFSVETIHAVLSKISIPLDTITEDYTVTLSDVLDQMFSTEPALTLRQQQGSWEIAQRLLDVTGGVPRYVESALHAFLSNRDICWVLFEPDGNIPSAALLDRLFRRGGDVYRAVTAASLGQLGTVGAGKAGREKRAQRFTGLLQLLFLRERALKLSPRNIECLTQAVFSRASSTAQLLSHAQFWGIHRNVRSREGLVSFAVPSAVLDGLAPVLGDLQDLLPNLMGNDHDYLDPPGKESEQKVVTILAFHRILATLLRHNNWLGLMDDANEPLIPLNFPAVNIAVFKPGASSDHVSRVWELPRLPSVHPHGRLRDARAVQRSITFDDVNASNLSQVSTPHSTNNPQDQEHESVEVEDSALERKCRPALFGRYLSSLSSEAFHAFRTAPRSPSGHFLVQYGTNVTYLHVTHRESPTMLSVLQACGQIAPIVKASPELQHTLAFLIMQPEARAEAVRAIGSLSSKHLAAQLKATLVNLKELDPGNKSEVLERKNMRQAANMIHKGKLKVVILDDAQYSRFAHYRELAKQLVITHNKVTLV